ncbi:MAG: D-alanyl-D-alanine carboxypeptidase [Firmicutes bacterium]|nr:D-alanyl-D-alanine carboxypeptidase [Bacillota bacterium]
MKKSQKPYKQALKILFVVLLVVAMIVLYCIGSFAYVFAATERNGIELNGTAAAIYVDESNSYLWDYQGDKQYDPASTTKLLTCLVAAEHLKLNSKVKVTKEALKVTDTVLFLQEGEKVTVKTLMHLALMESHNEAAKMLAIATSGSEKKFAKLMDAKAKEIGCTNSKFKNSTGLSDPRNYCTAKDMCLITEAALSNTTIRKICAKAEYKIPASNKHDAKTLKNTNLFLAGGTVTESDGSKTKVKKIKEIFGGKTGTTVKYKGTMTVACEIEGLDVYITVLNSTINGKYKDIANLVDYAKSNINPYVAVEKGKPTDKKAKVKGGAVRKVPGEIKEDGIINLPEGASAALVLVKEVFDEDIEAPVSVGDKIGKAVIYLADEEVSSVDIVATKDVPEGWIFSKIGIPNSVAIVIIVVLSVIVILFIIIRILRGVNRAKARARRKERIKEIALKQLERERDVDERNWPYK